MSPTPDANRHDTDDDVRAALSRVAGRIPLPPASHGGPADSDLVNAVHRRAIRISRRRTAGRGVLVVASVVAVIAGVTGIGGLLRPTDRPSDAGPAVSSTPVQPASPGLTSAPSPAPTSVPSASSPPSSIDPRTVRPPAWADGFTGTAVDRTRWTVYGSGANTDYSAWSPSDAAVSGGALHLSVTRSGPGTSGRVATSGGIGALRTASANGRWELRWRMTDGPGVIGQFLLTDSPATATPRKPHYLVTLQPSAGTLTFEDATAGKQATVRLDGGEFHTVAVELSPAAVQLRVDGKVQARWAADRTKAVPLWPALQTLLAGPDCGASPLPGDCGGARTTFPQRLDVDRFRYFAAP